MIATDLGDRVQRLPDAGRRLCLHDRHGFDRPGPPEGLLHSIRLDALTPGGLYPNGLCPAPLHDRHQSRAEYAIDSDDDGIAGLDHVDDRGFHAG